MENRRRYQRIALSLSAEAINASGMCRRVDLIELSQQGLALLCDQAAIDHLEALDPVSGRARFPVEIELRFTLTYQGETKTFNYRCRMVHKQRRSQNEYRCGFLLLETGEEESELLTAFLEHSIDEG
ncbi:PilZ domain-containing protein [Candidatus Reidiella endopervernicosa]|uniref:PilZ domain-containing protein n=1 Tax=Candidatus Reidiella endopervernicosa TaxID=2738883 RepID=A0A6N0HZK7_9GAMM|nr:PilZ domain-containing protein [Candidatus Reidiella endopervernicosa]QKQ27817.1 PilZ domain-containing protein [Candidatus Reidiella endopervernicosa]